MKVAIVGLPQSGKSTLFSAVTGSAVDPYAQPDVHRAVVQVPDPRLQKLAELFKPKKVIHATIEFLDVPGYSLDDAKGRDDWRRALPAVRQAELLVVVVRGFVDETVPAVRDRIDPEADFAAMWDELIFADLDTVTTRVERLEKSLKKPTKTHEAEKRELGLLKRCCEALENEIPLASVITTDEDRRGVSSFAFLTQKPLICVRNVSDDQAGLAEGLSVDHVEASLALSASIEAEIAVLEQEDRADFLADLGLEVPARDRLIQESYAACGLISFLTTGSDEVRAWTIRKGATAVDAAGKVHTDLAHGFIRAETVAYDDLVAHAGLKGAKAAGKVRAEGRGYVVADGDVLNILSSA